MSESFSQQLPLKAYTVADGLASNFVNHIFQDSRGFIWFSTGEGLSRFDGYEFRNFDERDGLPAAPIRSVTEDDKGRLWVTTSMGIARLTYESEFEAEDPKSRPAAFRSFLLTANETFERKVANQANSMVFHPDGSLWCLTDYGLFKAADPNAADMKFEAVVERDTAFSRGAARDKNGSLWFGLADELVEVRGTEIISHAKLEVPFPKDLISKLQITSDGRIIVLHVGGLLEFVPSRVTGQRGSFKKIEVSGDGDINGFLLRADGSIWVARPTELTRFDPGSESAVVYSGAFDKTSTSVTFGQDRDDNLWMEIYGNGVRLMSSESVANFIPSGDEGKTVGAAFEDTEGNMWAILNDGFARPIRELNSKPGKLFSGTVPSTLAPWFARIDGRWQLGTENSYTFAEKPLLKLRSGKTIDVSEYVQTNGIYSGSRFYEDEQGTLWIAKPGKKIHRGTPQAGGGYKFEAFEAETHFSSFGSRMIGDGADGVWLGNPLFLGRIRNGQYEQAKVSAGLPERDPRSMFRDSRGWLWIGHRNKGVSVTREPGADDPHFINYSRLNSPLPSNAVRSITEGADGRMYFATDRGLARFDTGKNEWALYSTRTGLAGDQVYGVFRDSKGIIWAGTNGGLSRVDDGKERAPRGLPPTYISSLSIGGRNIALPINGASAIPWAEIGQSDNSLIIGYVAPHFDGRDISYQYRLDNGEWSAPTKERTVNFSLLRAGSYLFEVRAIDSHGTVSPAPAVFEFRILPPIYQRWWFVFGALGLVGLVTYQIYRMRVRRLLEIERTRTRIATDLHDDIGTNLSKISLLSEIVKMRGGADDPEGRRLLDVIGETSRESVGAMSDIVWAISPRHDSLPEMVSRMRRYIEEVFAEKETAIDFRAPVDGKDTRLTMETRRELYLIFKEAVNNAAKYSGCKNITVTLEYRPYEIHLKVEDDGCGISEGAEQNGGNGLKNLQLRAERIGARLVVESQPGEGTSISVWLPQTG